MSELSSCPFCGGPATKDAYDRGITIGCAPCGYSRHFPGLLQTVPNDKPIAQYRNGSGGITEIPASEATEFYHADANERAAEVWNHRAPVSTPQQSAQRASVDTPTDEQISAIYRSTFPRGPYLVTPDVHKFARAILAWGSAGSGTELDKPLYSTRQDAARFRKMKEWDFTDEYCEYTQNRLNGFPVGDLDAMIDAAIRAAAPSPAPQGEQA